MRTAVPETAVYEYCNTAAYECNVRTSRRFGVMQPIACVTKRTQ
jgi:hypothetical protein